MQVLVTGASGFLGSHVVDELRAAGHEVRVLVRSTSRLDHLEHHGEAVARAVGAVDAPETLAAAVAGCEAIVSCAGLTKARDEAEFDRVNQGGPVNLLDAARAAGAPLRRFVHISSLAAAGPSQDGAAREEDEPCAPLSAYGRSKRRGEEAVLARAGEVPVTVIRPPAIYGPRDAEIFAFFSLAKRARLAPIIGSGKTRISMIYGPDCARAARAAVEDASGRSGAVYHVDDGGAWTWGEMADALRGALGKRIFSPRIPVAVFGVAALFSEAFGKLTGKAMIFNRDKVRDMRHSYVGGHARIQRELGWTPSVDFRDGAKLTVAWYREAGWL
ncbi:MAG TPA: NAD-dependent epimerase/dehydratase family protein [Myxococcota bacterium]|jgi:nucleoside-diphosphate-sugar epimerase|nr:NAD-dependent epimerase/dehydratase family protein [Myxococcota bacterium]